MRFHTSVLLGLLAANVSIAAKVGKFDVDKCADPSGMKKCYEKAKSAYNDCDKKNCEKDVDGTATSDSDCLNKCGCTRDQAYIDCAASSCWNQVYSCEYQMTVSGLFETCEDQSVDSIPFWPAPEDAAGACSCAIGEVDKIANEAMRIQDKQCGLKSSASDSKIDECKCCGYSAMLSSFPNTCPKNDPAQLKLDKVEQAYNALGWEDCAKTLENVDCAKDYGYPKLDTYYKPGKIPSGGNATFSNTGGSLTSPVSATVTWSAGSSAHTVTAVSTDAVKATGSGSSDSANASATSGDSASGTASASATATTGAAVRAGMDSYLWAGLAAAAVFVQA